MLLSSGTTIGRTPRQTTARAAAQMPLSSGTTIGRTPRQTTARAAAQMLLSAGTTIGRTPGRPLPGLLLRCRFPQVRPMVVPAANHCPGCCSDATFLRYDHRSYPRQTAARATAQMLLSSGTTIGRTPRQTTTRAAAQRPLSSGTTIGRTPGRPLPGLPLRCCSPQVRPSVVPLEDLCPGYCSDAALHRYDHRSYPRQTTARATAQMLLSTGTTIGRTPRQTSARAAAQMLLEEEGVWSAYESSVAQFGL